MRAAFRLILRGILVLVGVVVIGLALLLVVFGWSSSSTERAHGECEMLVIEKKIEPVVRATEYRRACMGSKGYGMQSFCYVENYTTASCFIPRWMFWINKI